MAINMNWIASVYVWMGSTMVFLALFIIAFIFIIYLAKKTHAIVEFKASISKQPICLFFQENRYCEWKAIKPDAGIIIDNNYGAFIINEKATYVDKRTQNIMIPFDAQFGASLNVHAAKLVDDLEYIMKDEEAMKALRVAISNNDIDDTSTIQALKTSINFGAVKNITTALTPHNINAKIEKTIAQRLGSLGKVNVPQIILIFAAILGAIILGVIIIKTVL